MKTTAKVDQNASHNSDPSAFDAHELLALARLDIERGSLESALKKIKQLIADPEAPLEGLALAGRLYAQLGLWDRAKELLQKYVQRNPQALTEVFQLGMVHFDAGEIDEALKIWANVLQKQSTYPPALFYRALAFAQQGKPVEAREHLDLLLKSAAPDNLYFGRGKELLQAIEANRPATPPARETVAKTTEKPSTAPKDPYKTEH